MCSGSSIKSIVSSDLQFSRKSWYLMSRNRCSDVKNGYKTILERSSNHLVRFWKLRQPQDHSNLGWIDDCTYFPFSCKFKQNKQHPKWPSTQWDVNERFATQTHEIHCNALQCISLLPPSLFLFDPIKKSFFHFSFMNQTFDQIEAHNWIEVTPTTFAPCCK